MPKRSLTFVAILVAMVISACGGDDGGGGGASGPEGEVQEAILDWTFNGNCDRMTDKFLQEQAFVGNDREERCDFFEKAYVKPQYSKDDVKFRKTEVTGQRATVTIGSDIANVEATYTLVRPSGGDWQIDTADIN